MTQTEAIRAIRALGLSVRVTDGEFRVTFKKVSPRKAEAIAYYTDDAQDAVDVATRMAG